MKGTDGSFTLQILFVALLVRLSEILIFSLYMHRLIDSVLAPVNDFFDQSIWQYHIVGVLPNIDIFFNFIYIFIVIDKS